MAMVYQRGAPIVARTIPALPSKESPAAQILRRFARSSYAALRRLHCDYHGGVLTLEGCVPTFYTKQIAIALISQVSGIEQFVDRVEVRERPRGAP